MIFIAWKNLLHEKTRFILSVLGISFAILLMFAIKGIAVGINETIVKYTQNQGVEIFITQKGIKNMQMTSSFFPSYVLDQIKKMDGVAKAEGIYGFNYQYEIKRNGKTIKIASYLIGFDKMGGPWKIKEGKSKPGDNEVIVDFAFAQKGGFQTGDSIEIMGHKFKIVGISRETNPMGGLFIFANKSTLDKIMKSDKTINMILIKVKYGTNVETLIEKIDREIPLVNALKSTQLAQNDADMINELFDPVINGIIFLVVIVSTAFIGLTIYNATLEKLGEYTILKAIGATKNQLFTVVFFQSFAIALLGTFFGFLLSYVVSYLADKFMPEIAIATSFNIALKYLWIVPFMSVAATYIPLRKIFSIDEADVLRN